MTLHLPPPSDPPDRAAVDRGFGYREDRCPYCQHDWHGLVCRHGACYCLGSHHDRASFADDLDAKRTQPGGILAKSTSNAIVAAGGWCAPSQQIYDLAVDRLAEGLDVPPALLGDHTNCRCVIHSVYDDVDGTTE